MALGEIVDLVSEQLVLVLKRQVGGQQVLDSEFQSGEFLQGLRGFVECNVIYLVLVFDHFLEDFNRS